MLGMFKAKKVSESWEIWFHWSRRSLQTQTQKKVAYTLLAQFSEYKQTLGTFLLRSGWNTSFEQCLGVCQHNLSFLNQL